MSERVIRDTATGKNVDEHLEVVFSEVYHNNISDPIAIGKLLDPYTLAINDNRAILFENSLDDISAAIAWATQFGELRVGAADKSLLPLDDHRDVKWFAKIGDDKPDQCRVYGSTIQQVIVLAGVQVLREIAAGMLNNLAENQQSH